MNEEPRPTERAAVADDTLRKYPFIVPWTQGDYIKIRYLAACRGKKLAAVGIEAVHLGLQIMARETVADHIRRGKPVPQRLALLAQGEITRPGSNLQP